MATPESKVKAALDRMLKAERVWFYPPQAGPFGGAGIPDRVAVVEGLFVGIECKADATKKPTALQIKCMADIEKAGGKCFVVYDKTTIEQVREWIHARRTGGEGSRPQAE
jgi:hypothetical protein